MEEDIHLPPDLIQRDSTTHIISNKVDLIYSVVSTARFVLFSTGAT